MHERFKGAPRDIAKEQAILAEAGARYGSGALFSYDVLANEKTGLPAHTCTVTLQQAMEICGPGITGDDQLWAKLDDWHATAEAMDAARLRLTVEFGRRAYLRSGA